MLNITSAISKYIAALLSVALCLFTTVPAMVEENRQSHEADISEQTQRLTELEELYASPNYTPIDESRFTAFDLAAAYKNGVRFNEVSFVASHNSYQKPRVPSYKKLMSDVSTVAFGLLDTEKYNFDNDTLTQQLNLGIRSLELDIETLVTENGVEFVCSHTPNFDTPSNCYKFLGALREIKMWSDANPNHLPITVIIEPKKVFLPEKNMRFFNMKYVNELDSLLREVLGDSLITPAQAMGEYGSLKEMREADGWPTLQECAGGIMVLLHDTTVTEKYISQDKTLKTQAMFPMLRYDDRDRDCASFLLINKPAQALEHSDEMREKRLVVRTQVDTYGSYSDEKTCAAFDSGAQILSTDYAPRADAENAYRSVCFDGGYTVSLK